MVRDLACFAGVDWATETHHVCVASGDGLKRFMCPTTVHSKKARNHAMGFSLPTPRPTASSRIHGALTDECGISTTPATAGLGKRLWTMLEVVERVDAERGSCSWRSAYRAACPSGDLRYVG